jgi:hypothetical protein
MNKVQKAEMSPGIAAVATPETIKNWTLCTHWELAPCLSHILYAATQTASAKDKNKKKNPEVVCNFYPLWQSF